MGESQMVLDAFKRMNVEQMAHDAIARAFAKYEPLHTYYAKHNGKEPRNIVEAAIQMQEFKNASRECGFED